MKTKISVIVCTYNREKFIKDCLEHLYNQSIDKIMYEVIVVNNNCTDNTEEIVSTFIKHHSDLNIRQITEENQGLSYARNRGLEEAKFNAITYIDDDGIASSDFLEQISSCLDKNPHFAGIGGKVIPLYETYEPEWYNDFLRMMVTKIDFGEESFKCYGKKYPAGCNMTYRKEWLIKSGGFNNALKWRADDKYIFHEISKLNDNIFYIPLIKVGHHIDKERITDENFDRLSALLGSEERLRVLSKNNLIFISKLGEFVFKFLSTFIIALFFLLKGQWIKGKYVIRFRWHALKGFIKASS